MTATTLSHRARGGYGFRGVARMEWQKLRTVRSTWYLVAIFAASMIGLAVLVLGQENDAPVSAAGRAAFDPTYRSFLGLVLGQLLFGVCQQTLKPDDDEITEQVGVNILGASSPAFLLKAADHLADGGLDFSLGFHWAGNSKTVAKICSTFPKSPGLTRW